MQEKKKENVVCHFNHSAQFLYTSHSVLAFPHTLHILTAYFERFLRAHESDAIFEYE